MRTHFIEVRDERGPSRSPHPRGHYDIASAILTAVHGENVRRWASEDTPGIAVAFPGLIKDTPFQLGVARAFGTADEIRGLAKVLRTMLDTTRLVVVDEVDEVGGKRSLKAAAFCRDRRPEKEVVGYHDRALRRAQRKVMERLSAGGILEKVPMTSAERDERRIQMLTENDGYVKANVNMHSTSTKSNFSMWIIPVSSNGLSDGQVDSYGLSRMAQTVPLPHF